MRDAAGEQCSAGGDTAGISTTSLGSSTVPGSSMDRPASTLLETSLQSNGGYLGGLADHVLCCAWIVMSCCCCCSNSLTGRSHEAFGWRLLLLLVRRRNAAHRPTDSRNSRCWQYARGSRRSDSPVRGWLDSATRSRIAARQGSWLAADIGRIRLQSELLEGDRLDGFRAPLLSCCMQHKIHTPEDTPPQFSRLAFERRTSCERLYPHPRSLLNSAEDSRRQRVKSSGRVQLGESSR